MIMSIAEPWQWEKPLKGKEIGCPIIAFQASLAMLFATEYDLLNSSINSAIYPYIHTVIKDTLLAPTDFKTTCTKSPGIPRKRLARARKIEKQTPAKTRGSRNKPITEKNQA